MTDAEPAPSLLAPGLILLLIACWLGGGVTVDPGPMDEWLQLLALPLLALAAWHLSRQSAGGGLQRPAMLALVLIALVPLLQLLPLPPALEPFKPYWIALALIFWAIEAPERVGLGFAFCAGVVSDEEALMRASDPENFLRLRRG